MPIIEVGQEAGEVQFSAELGELKNSQGEVVMSFDSDQNVAVNITGGTTYRPKTIEATTANHDLTAENSGATVILTASGTARLPAITTAATVGIQFVIMNATAAAITGAIVRDAGNTADFYDSDTTSGESAPQDIDAMKAKTVIAIGINKWGVIG